MIRIFIYIKSWIYFPKLIKYLQKCNPQVAEYLKKTGRHSYAKFLSSKNPSEVYANGIRSACEEWKCCFREEPIERVAE